jgi:alpha-L-rhamnosidase
MLKRFFIFSGVIFFGAGIVFAKQPSPVVKSEFIFEHNLPGVPFSHAPTIAQTPFGLVVAWFGGTSESNPDTKIFVSRLETGKKNWSTPVMVAQMTEGRVLLASWNPVLFQQKDGPLFLFYKIGKDPKNWKGMFKVSSDGGKIWGASNRLPDGILGPVKNKPIELDNGLILFPSSTQLSNKWKVFIEAISPKSPSDLLVKNNWSIAGPLNDQTMSVIQPALLDLGDGNILLLCRSRQFNLFLPQTIMQARSADFGRTWSKLGSSGLPNPNSGIDAVVLKDGRCLLVYNPTRLFRTNLDVTVSKDQGKTWRHLLRLENRLGEYSYPSIIQSSDGMIHIVYTWQRRKIRHVVIDPGKIL